MSITVRLTEQEMMWGALVGVARHAESVAKARKDAHGFDATASGLSLHIEGACGELAVAKWRGAFWGGDRNTFKGADLGSRVQVRTRSKHDYDLIVREDDADDHAFILVTGTAPLFVIRGWMWGQEAKQPEFRQNHGGRPPAYFVPASALRPMAAKQEVLSA